MASAAVCIDPTEDFEPITLEESFVVLEPYYEAVLRDYKQYGLTKVTRTRLFVAPHLHDSARHFAACKDDGSAILLAPELANMSEAIIFAIIAHELGHASDFLYPGEFVLGRERECARRTKSEHDEKQWSRWLKSWHKRDDDVVELTADAIAERVMEVPYGYQGPCLLQSFDATRARPMGLR